MSKKDKKNFLNFFTVGDTVYILRHKGWKETDIGVLQGKITFLMSYYAVVEDYHGSKYIIEKVEDIKHG